MRFVEKSTLAVDRNPNGSYDQEVPTFLVSEQPVLMFDSDQSSYGSSCCYLYPAWSKGERCFLFSKYWQSAFGYIATGFSEEIITFEEGVKLLVEHHVYNFGGVK